MPIGVPHWYDGRRRRRQRETSSCPRGCCSRGGWLGARGTCCSCVPSTCSGCRYGNGPADVPGASDHDDVPSSSKLDPVEWVAVGHSGCLPGAEQQRRNRESDRFTWRCTLSSADRGTDASSPVEAALLASLVSKFVRPSSRVRRLTGLLTLGDPRRAEPFEGVKRPDGCRQRSPRRVMIALVTALSGASDLKG